MKKNRFLHVVLTFVLMFGMLFSLAGTPASAAKVSLKSLPSAKFETNDTSDKFSEEDIKDSGHVQLDGLRNGIRVSSIVVYPSLIIDGSINYDEEIYDS